MARIQLFHSTPSSNHNLCAPHDGEIGHALVADSVCWAAGGDLSWRSPALVGCAVVWGAGLALAGIVGWVDGNTDAWVRALHHGDVVGSTRGATIGASAVLEECLRVPLAVAAPVCVTRQTHADGREVGWDGVMLASLDSLGVGHLDHLEAGVDLVGSEVLVIGAVVVDVDEEGVGTVLLVVALAVEAHVVGVRVRVGERDSAGTEGQREGKAEQLHFGVCWIPFKGVLSSE